MGCVGSKEKPAQQAARPAATTTATAVKTKDTASNHADVPEGDENRLDADCTWSFTDRREALPEADFQPTRPSRGHSGQDLGSR